MKMLTIPEHCVRTRGVACERCRIACPVGAISFESETGGPVIDDELCTRCGICMGICDAFSSDTLTVPYLYDHLRRVAMQGEIVYLTCEENVFPGLEPADNVTVLPCLGCIPPEMWTLLLAQNVPLCIACDLRYCETCERAQDRGQLLFTRSVEIAESLTGREVKFDQEIPEIDSEGEGGEFGRREVFGTLKDDALDVISGKRHLRQSDTLKDIYRDKERRRMQELLNLSDGEVLNEFAEGGRTMRTISPRRKMLLEAMHVMPEVGERAEFVVSETDYDRCVECLDCVGVCPTGARMASPEDGSLAYDPRFCIGCEKCVGACPKNAIELVAASGAELKSNGNENEA